MIRPGYLFYRSKYSWRITVAFGAAALIHFAAVALANIHRHEQIDEAPSLPPGIPELEFESTPIDPTPPPDVPDPPPLLDPTEDLFSDARPKPPPIRTQDTRLVRPGVKARNSSPGSLTLSSGKVFALSAPRPEYPYEARRQKIVGSGIVAISVDLVSGHVTDVSMWQSTGSSVLDNATMTAFRRWRFKPGTVSRVKSPITFTMTGAQY
ncbi:MAG: periplasmic protein TonB [Verrucomicrobiota bacterium]